MFDLLALAFQTDQTRVFTFMLCREFSVRTYPNLGVTDPHHTVSHTQNRPALIAAHTKVNTYHVQLFGRFLERLRATPDGDGTLLDHSTILYGSGMGDGNNHTPSPLPIVIAGGHRVPRRTSRPHTRQDPSAESAAGPLASVWCGCDQLRHQHRSGITVRRCLSRAARGVRTACILVLGLTATSFAAAGDLRLLEAVKQRDAAAVETLIRSHVDVNAPEGDGTTALHWAVQADDIQIATALIKGGAKVTQTNRLGVTPLMLAATNGSVHLIDALLKAGASPNEASFEGETVLMTAARTGNAQAVGVLLEAGANVNARESWRGETALMWAGRGRPRRGRAGAHTPRRPGRRAIEHVEIPERALQPRDPCDAAAAAGWIHRADVRSTAGSARGGNGPR
jgi:hypothetical protein